MERVCKYLGEKLTDFHVELETLHPGVAQRLIDRMLGASLTSSSWSSSHESYFEGNCAFRCVLSLSLSQARKPRSSLRWLPLHARRKHFTHRAPPPTNGCAVRPRPMGQKRKLTLLLFFFCPRGWGWVCATQACL
jgi:hypothetical protein